MIDFVVFEVVGCYVVECVFVWMGVCCFDMCKVFVLFEVLFVVGLFGVFV